MNVKEKNVIPSCSIYLFLGWVIVNSKLILQKTICSPSQIWCHDAGSEQHRDDELGGLVDRTSRGSSAQAMDGRELLPYALLS